MKHIQNVPSKQLTSSNEVDLPESSLIICSPNWPNLQVELVHSILQGNELPSEIISIDDSDDENRILAQMTPNHPVDSRPPMDWPACRLERQNKGKLIQFHHYIYSVFPEIS